MTIRWVQVQEGYTESKFIATEGETSSKGKVIPLQNRCGPEGG